VSNTTVRGRGGYGKGRGRGRGGYGYMKKEEHISIVQSTTYYAEDDDYKPSVRAPDYKPATASNDPLSSAPSSSQVYSSTNQNEVIRLLQGEKRALEADNHRLRRENEQISYDMERARGHHEQEVMDIKKRHWCQTCWIQAVYYCCWDASYCSSDCQTVHWNSGHRNGCRRRKVFIEEAKAKKAAAAMEKKGASTNPSSDAVVSNQKHNVSAKP
jgi:hypothetical protein